MHECLQHYNRILYLCAKCPFCSFKQRTIEIIAARIGERDGFKEQLAERDREIAELKTALAEAQARAYPRDAGAALKAEDIAPARDGATDTTRYCFDCSTCDANCEIGATDHLDAMRLLQESGWVPVLRRAGDLVICEDCYNGLLHWRRNAYGCQGRTSRHNWRCHQCRMPSPAVEVKRHLSLETHPTTLGWGTFITRGEASVLRLCPICLEVVKRENRDKADPAHRERKSRVDAGSVGVESAACCGPM